MSEEMMNLRALGEKTPDCALLRERIGLAAERRMELEVGTATGAAYGEKESGRKAQRNGSRDRDWVDEGQKTVRGTVFPRRAGREGGVAPPEAADGPLFPRLARTKASGWPRRRLAKALTAVLQEACVQGSSTRSLDAHMHRLLGYHPHPDERTTLLLVGPDALVLVVPSVNAGDMAARFDLPIHASADEDGPAQALTSALAAVVPKGPVRLLLDEAMRADAALLLLGQLGRATHSFATETVGALRMITDAGEYAALKQATLVADAAIRCGVKAIRPGMTEAQVTTAIRDGFTRHDTPSAFCLVASGPNGAFAITLDCPNDRYINDEAICQAAVGMLGQIGLQTRLNAQPKALFFRQIGALKTDFYMLGWGAPAATQNICSSSSIIPEPLSMAAGTARAIPTLRWMPTARPSHRKWTSLRETRWLPRCGRWPKAILPIFPSTTRCRTGR